MAEALPDERAGLERFLYLTMTVVRRRGEGHMVRVGPTRPESVYWIEVARPPYHRRLNLEWRSRQSGEQAGVYCSRRRWKDGAEVNTLDPSLMAFGDREAARHPPYEILSLVHENACTTRMSECCYLSSSLGAEMTDLVGATTQLGTYGMSGSCLAKRVHLSR